MVRARKFFVAFCTFAVALGIGFLMQYSDAFALKGEDSAAVPVIAMSSTVPLGVQPSRPFEPVQGTAPEVARMVILASQSRPDAIQPPTQPPERLSQIAIDAPAAQPREERPPMTAACAPVLSAEAAEGALIALDLVAGCHAATPVTVHHAGMIFSTVTDDAGRVQIDVPALAAPALVIVDVMGQAAVATVAIPDLDQYHRAVLQWQGATPVSLHALENGATYGGAGHVSETAPGSQEALLAGAGGSLVTLGDAAAPMQFFAQVYSFPAGPNASSEIALNVQAEVTAAACGTAIAAQTIQVTPGAPTTARDLSVTLPGCEATGEFLVLSNMLRDLTVASR